MHGKAWLKKGLCVFAYSLAFLVLSDIDLVLLDCAN